MKQKNYNIALLLRAWFNNFDMNDLPYTIEDNRLLEALADIAYLAGQKGFFSGDSRNDIAEFIIWAKEFEEIHDETDWDEVDYMDTLEAFTLNKLRIDAQ